MITHNRQFITVILCDLKQIRNINTAAFKSHKVNLLEVWKVPQVKMSLRPRSGRPYYFGSNPTRLQFLSTKVFTSGCAGEILSVCPSVMSHVCNFR